MRALNRLLALLVGLALIGAGGFMALETILAATGEPFVVIPGRQWLRVLRHTPWSSSVVIAVMAVIAAAGLVLLVAEVRRWSRWRTPVVVAGGPARWWVTRRSVDAHLSRQLQARTGALRPRPRLTPRDQHWRIKVVAGIPGDEEGGVPAHLLTGQIEDVAHQVLAQMGAPEPSRVKVRLRSDRAAKHGQVAR